MSYTIVGVIGHIDHGKTSVVGALTGVDTDTHPEEKRRGITIDLGFASYRDGDHEFAFIDAPGHQKYIGNLLAGVSGIDVGLLVVACDQGIQEQTLEHAAILQTLGVKKLIAAISRIDLSDETTQNGLAEELEVFLADYGFNDVPTIPISSVTGEGIGALKAQLCDYARAVGRSTAGYFRMPIDRVFSVPGRGCVVAGTVWSGSVKIGDTVELAGSRQSVRVRELEVHGECVDHSAAGLRTAMNVTGVSAAELKRGDELVAGHANRPLNRLAVELKTFSDAPEIRCPATVQFHTATKACEARITGPRSIKPGERTIAVIDTHEPIIATFTQQFLLRNPYPVGTLGGGRVLAPIEGKFALRRGLTEFGQQLADADAVDRLCAWATRLGELEVDPIMFELHLGIPGADCDEVVALAIEQERLSMPVDGVLVATAATDRIRNYVLKVLTTQAEETDNAWSDEESVIRRARSTGTPPVVRWAINQLLAEKQLVRVNRMIAVASRENLLSKKQRAWMAQIVGLYDGERSPPNIKELADRLETKIDAIASLVRFATQQGILLDVGGGFLISAKVFAWLCRELHELFEEQAVCSVAEIRDHWNVTRKHAIPYLEYCDKVGATTRNDISRVAGPKLQEFMSEQMVE